MVYTLRFFSLFKSSLFHNSNVFGSYIIHILYTGCAKIKKKNNSGAKSLMLFILFPDVEIYRSVCFVMYACEPFEKSRVYSLLAWVRLPILTLPMYKTDSSRVRYSKTRQLQVHSLLNFLTISD